MDKEKIFDFMGIGIGPFNLSLAALADQVDGLDAIFFEKKEEFDWHPGMLIDGTDLQVPFLADLVTLADPQSPYTFLNYLHHHNRLFQFYFFKRFDIPRKEYNDYAQWAASNLASCHFGRKVTDVISHQTDQPYYEVKVQNNEDKEEVYFSRHIVLGTGSIPNIPDAFGKFPEADVLHTSNYLYNENHLKQAGSITVIGSGQSAAEVFQDLLRDQTSGKYQLTWFTRSAGFFQLESAKLGQEFFSPDYVDYFHGLSFDKRKEALPTLNQIRKGIDPETLKAIYDLLYHRSIGREGPPVIIQPLTELKDISLKEGGKGYRLTCRQWQEEHTFTHDTEKVILGTGYKPYLPDWFEQIKEEIEWEDDDQFKVAEDYRLKFRDKRPNHIFTLTNLLHTHGAGATNLGLAVPRNQMIINAITGKEIYPVRKNSVFQSFTQHNSHEANNSKW